MYERLYSIDDFIKELNSKKDIWNRLSSEGKTILVKMIAREKKYVQQ